MKYFNKEVIDSFQVWNEKVMEPRITKKTKELVAVACTYMTRCPYCIEGHTKAALKAGTSKQEIA